MAIVSSLSMPLRRKLKCASNAARTARKKFCKVCHSVLLTALLLTVLSGCGTSPKSTAPKTAPPVVNSRDTVPGRAPPPGAAAPSVGSSVGTSAGGSETSPVTATTPVPTSPTPELPKQNVIIPSPRPLPRVGLILGPGGLKAYAHLGVLREFARARIPIHAMVGLEWGAVIGGLYAQQAQINDAEWKAFRLREDELPDSGFLTSRASSNEIGALDGFLNNAFAAQIVERARIAFACPSAQLHREKVFWFARGSMRDVVAKCAAYPPLYHANSGYLASPMNVEDAAKWLRSQGATVVVLVDVLAGGSAVVVKGDLAEQVLWSEIQRRLAAAKTPIVDVTIGVNTGEASLRDFNARRGLIEVGQKAAVEPVNKMVSTYGF